MGLYYQPPVCPATLSAATARSGCFTVKALRAAGELTLAPRRLQLQRLYDTGPTYVQRAKVGLWVRVSQTRLKSPGDGGRALRYLLFILWTPRLTEPQLATTSAESGAERRGQSAPATSRLSGALPFSARSAPRGRGRRPSGAEQTREQTPPVGSYLVRAGAGRSRRDLG